MSRMILQGTASVQSSAILKDLNAQLARRRDQVVSSRVHPATGRIIVEALAEERSHLEAVTINANETSTGHTFHTRRRSCSPPRVHS